MIVTDDVLDLAKNDTLVIDTLIDCIIIGNKVAIFNIGNFERIYDIREYYMQNSNEVFGYLTNRANYTIINLDRYREQCENNYTFLRKISSIKELEIYSKLSLTRINEFSELKHLGLKFEGNSVEFPSLYKFINLYNDDNLKSDLTDNNYLSSQKKKL